MSQNVPAPPEPFEPLEEIIKRDALLFRVFTVAAGRGALSFNPGYGSVTRFGFFGQPRVPILYAADSLEAAVCETLLHDVPVEGGQLLTTNVDRSAAAGIRPTRNLRLAKFHGTGLRRLKVTQAQLTDTPPTKYDRTVRWAEAAYSAGFDGISWMSAKCNTDRAFVLFGGDRVATEDLRIDREHGHIFLAGADREWLIEFCATLHIDVSAPVR
ncbi:RES family NAD+ phosphorylase [Saxibacter everestensis]|uniref:RES family NAD+ phosphorylase n=1 Tax=Saxibacter everestensis TaxID=2909229 RepID=A0ABY8QV95_9MICO|nr:RES family NAD+ phosphorylase [Brevibacteriaceae bacterium ZFBP1038]